MGLTLSPQVFHHPRLCAGSLTHIAHIAHDVFLVGTCDGLNRAEHALFVGKSVFAINSLSNNTCMRVPQAIRRCIDPYLVGKFSDPQTVARGCGEGGLRESISLLRGEDVLAQVQQETKGGFKGFAKIAQVFYKTFFHHAL